MDSSKSIENYFDALGAIFDCLKKHEIETIFMTPNMMNTYVSSRTSTAFVETAKLTAEMQNSGIMDDYIECARKTCREKKILVCDCYKKWKAMHDAGVETTSLLSNHINHPTRELHGLFASSLFNMLMWEDIK